MAFGYDEWYDMMVLYGFYIYVYQFISPHDQFMWF